MQKRRWRTLGTYLTLGLAVLVAGACDDGGGDGDGAADAGPAGPDAVVPGFLGPDKVCPGAPGCTGAGGDAKLSVGVGAQVWTPTIPETFTDTNLNGERDSDEPFVDANANGTFDPIWIFGGTPANGVKTDVEARALVFAQHDLRVGVVSIDATGILMGDMDAIRQDPAVVALDLDHVVVMSTHAHSAPDTIGISNANPLVSGYDPAIAAGMRAAAVAALAEAVMTLEPARMKIASTLVLDDPNDPMSGTDNFAKDIRDPQIYDPTLTIAQFVADGEPTRTIATLVHWADHPEVAVFSDPPQKNLISAHYPHWLRKALESGAGDGAGAIEGLGGTAVFLNGALGGQIGTLRGTTPIGLDGVPVTVLSHEMDQALGESVAKRALDALAGEGAVEVAADQLPLGFRTAGFSARVDHTGFQVFFLIGVLAPHAIYGYDMDQNISDTNVPWIPLRATYVQVGPLGMVTAPGELHPELWVGVHADGSWSWGNPVLNPEITANVPDLSTAPDPPFLRDLVLANEGVQFPVLLGMAEDYIGYIVPAYNYVLHPSNPYLEEAEGDHYEEVYSLGPDVEAHAIHPILELVKWRP